MTMQEALAMILYLLQNMANVQWKQNTLTYIIATELLWAIFVLCVAEITVVFIPLLAAGIKVCISLN